MAKVPPLVARLRTRSPVRHADVWRDSGRSRPGSHALRSPGAHHEPPRARRVDAAVAHTRTEYIVYMRARMPYLSETKTHNNI